MQSLEKKLEYFKIIRFFSQTDSVFFLNFNPQVKKASLRISSGSQAH